LTGALRKRGQDGRDKSNGANFDVTWDGASDDRSRELIEIQKRQMHRLRGQDWNERQAIL